MVEYYTDKDDPERYFLFAFSPALGGNIVINSRTPLNARIYRLGLPSEAVTGANISIAINDYLQVMELKRVVLPPFQELLLSLGLGLGGNKPGQPSFLLGTLHY
jgi:hypothetical protein